MNIRQIFHDACVALGFTGNARDLPPSPLPLTGNFSQTEAWFFRRDFIGQDYNDANGGQNNAMRHYYTQDDHLLPRIYRTLVAELGEPDRLRSYLQMDEKDNLSFNPEAIKIAQCAQLLTKIHETTTRILNGQPVKPTDSLLPKPRESVETEWLALVNTQRPLTEMPPKPTCHDALAYGAQLLFTLADRFEQKGTASTEMLTEMRFAAQSWMPIAALYRVNERQSENHR